MVAFHSSESGWSARHMEIDTLILAAAQIASGMVGRSNPTVLVQGSNPKEIAEAAVAIALAIGERARDAMAD